jgi:putative salt-induced outer membrane protein YdiY
LNDIANVRWNTLISLELPLSKWFSLRAGFENTYESVVAENRKQNDSRVTFGFSIGNK